MKPSRFRFRAWDKKDKAMYAVTYIDTNGNGETMINGMKICSDDVILMQSTGLIDKKGKEIWEGDIIKGSKGDIATVKWTGEEWGTEEWAMKPLWNDWKVIGNKWEN